VSTEPVPVRGTDGATHLAYELYLTNITSIPVTITSVQALDSETGGVLQDVSGDDLLDHSRVVGTAPATTPPTEVVIGGGQMAIVWMSPSVERAAEAPTAVHHRITATFPTAPSPLIGTSVTEDRIAGTRVSRVAAPVVSSPLGGTNWLDGNGCCDDVTAHRGASNPIDGQYFFAERFAIDWVQLTDELTLTTGDPTQLSSYPYYGVPIHAVADGEIVAVSDELQDQVPGANPPEGSLTLDQYGGNYVVQSFDHDGVTSYAFYAHLKPGSAKSRLQVGQRVTAGEQVGELGNSGNTDAPHLHFHVMDGPDPLASNGVPFVFAEQDLVGQGTDASAIDTLFSGSPLPLAADGPTGPRQDEMPLFLDVVDLTPAAGSTSSSAGTTSSSAGTTSSSAGTTTSSSAGRTTRTSTGTSGG
jgi:hypothetical protein